MVEALAVRHVGIEVQRPALASGGPIGRRLDDALTFLGLGMIALEHTGASSLERTIQVTSGDHASVRHEVHEVLDAEARHASVDEQETVVGPRQGEGGGGLGWTFLSGDDSVCRGAVGDGFTRTTSAGEKRGKDEGRETHGSTPVRAVGRVGTLRVASLKAVSTQSGTCGLLRACSPCSSGVVPPERLLS
ncbi:hypothetical protein D187_001513 [Cystobacter fuscus DSM 2262]|uniref:Uncharacterized protein n=1 Tax=Cystobacter fuscus (strain ATCC 25194 / DSM 2262 / NBRC 100088 / M29) TaxID=1242864 RepID=S9PES0_CYSF2|nr:hypothetical protein D187_001513 [Cystobacter fuscus DSM 2262]